MTESIAFATSRPGFGDGSDQARLAERCARGDREAFEQLVSDHQVRIAATVYRLLGWSADAEDVVQDVFVTALEKIGSYRGQAALGTWLTRIAVNRCRSHQRKLSVRLRWFAKAVGRAETTTTDADGLARAETHDQVRKAVADLPTAFREVVVMRYLEGLSVAATAEVLGATESAVNVRLHRARAKLRETLADLAGDLNDD